MKLDPNLFVSDDVHERMVLLADGKEHKFYFREITGGEVRRFQLAEQSEDDEKRIEAVAVLISKSLCDEKGKPVLPVVQARRLKAQPMAALFSVVLEVNGYGAKKPSPSEGESGSATS